MGRTSCNQREVGKKKNLETTKISIEDVNGRRGRSKEMVEREKGWHQSNSYQS